MCKALRTVPSTERASDKRHLLSPLPPPPATAWRASVTRDTSLPSLQMPSNLSGWALLQQNPTHQALSWYIWGAISPHKQQLSLPSWSGWMRDLKIAGTAGHGNGRLHQVSGRHAWEGSPMDALRGWAAAAEGAEPQALLPLSGALTAGDPKGLFQHLHMD